MKKAIIIVFAILGYCGLIYYFLPEFTPDLNHIIPYLETTTGDNFILAENKSYSSNLYQVNLEGKINKIYSRLLPNNSDIVAFESVQDGRIYSIYQSGSTGTNKIQVTKLNDDWNSETVIGRLEYGSQLLVTSSAVMGDNLYFTAIDDINWKVFIYSCHLGAKEETELKEIMVRDLPKESKIADASYDGTYLYILDNTGHLGYFTQETYQYFDIETQGRVFWMEASSRGLLYTTSSGDSLWFLKNGKSNKVASLATDGLVDADGIENGERSTILSKEIDYTYTLYGEGGKIRIPCSEITYDFNILLKSGLSIFLILSFITFLFWLLVALAAAVRKKYHSIITTMVFFVVIINTLFIALLTVYIYNNSKSYLEKSRQVSNSLYGLMETFDISNETLLTLQNIDLEDFGESEWFDIIDSELLGTAIIPKDTGKTVLFSTEMVYYGEDDAFFLNARDCVNGRKLYSNYVPEIEELIRTAKETENMAEGIITLQGHIYGIQVYPTPLEYIYFVSKATMDDLGERSREMWSNSLIWACIYGMASAILLVFMLYRLMQPVKKITKAMEKVAGGIYELQDEILVNNEYGRMWVSLNKMCKALSMQQYARGNVVKYYSRFAPKKFEMLFGKSVLQEVSVGDTAQISASVGIISVAQKEEVLKNGIRGEYVRYINKLLEMISKCNDRSGGIILTNNGDIESTNVIYKEPEMTGDAALLFAIQSLQKLRDWEDNGKFETKPLILLHSGMFTCGLAGTHAQSYPFIASLELRQLEEYIKPIRQLGVQLVITQQMHSCLEKQYQQRYIGYIRTEDKQKFHLYEIMDACIRAEGRQKLETNDLFAEGLDLYYKNSFQKARSCFLEIARRSPADLVGKWYLFACEEKMAFSEKSYDEVEHGLFR